MRSIKQSKEDSLYYIGYRNNRTVYNTSTTNNIVEGISEGFRTLKGLVEENDRFCINGEFDKLLTNITNKSIYNYYYL